MVSTSRCVLNVLGSNLFIHFIPPYGMSVVFIVAFVIVAVFLVVKIIDRKQALAMKMVLALFFIFMVSAGYVYLMYDLDISSFDGLLDASKLYFFWLTDVFHTGARVTSYAIQQDWSVNMTNTTTP